MKDQKVQSLAMILAAMLLVSIPSLSFGQKDVKGFPGIPIYPGVETFLGEEYRGATDQDGHPWVWYEFTSKKLKDEWDQGAIDLMAKIINFYKVELKKLGWEYIGEGIGNHHWVKGKEAIAIGSVADYLIAYIHMSKEDAQANVTKLSDKEFIKAYVDSAKAAQKVYEKYGMKTADDYANKVFEMSSKSPEEYESFENRLQGDVRKTVKDVLKPFKVSAGRFKELKSEYEDMLTQYIAEHESEYTPNQLGFMAMGRLTD